MSIPPVRTPSKHKRSRSFDESVRRSNPPHHHPDVHSQLNHFRQQNVPDLLLVSSVPLQEEVIVKNENPPRINDVPNKINNIVEQEKLENKPLDWAIDIQKKLSKDLPYQAGHSIFKVPGSLRKLQPDVLTPQVVSIGPYHRNNVELQDMEYHKRRILQHVFNRTGLHPKTFVLAVFLLEEELRKQYEVTNEFPNDQEFLEVMLLDACFVLELFNAFANGAKYCRYSPKDPIFSSRGISPFIQRDLLMIENQIPLIVLEQLSSLVWRPRRNLDSVREIALKFFESMIPGRSQNQHIQLENPSQPHQHLLDIVRCALQPSQPLPIPSSQAPYCPLNPLDIACCFLENSLSLLCQTLPKLMCCKSNVEDTQQPRLIMHSVTRLRGAGIKFKKRNEAHSFMDVEYKNQTLYIPPLVIHGSTKSLFINLMAFEQYYSGCESHVTSYISFMDGLIDSPKDVQYLQEKGIIEHRFGCEEDVSTLINNLRKEIVFDPNNNYLKEIAKRLHTHFQNKRNAWKTTLKNEYFKDPWKIISLVAAAFLILLTLAQTLYTILGARAQPSCELALVRKAIAHSQHSEHLLVESLLALITP
ncbi:Protein of unknown function DUF247, plant [Dillenia turbinata]|uniref:Uncharacterized protein n=1 Tax=Dillenia turbinata TaxID=194707 RepID=A0AAN8UZU0_9MAGN